jgi:hypothetical protein
MKTLMASLLALGLLGGALAPVALAEEETSSPAPSAGGGDTTSTPVPQSGANGHGGKRCGGSSPSV